MRMESEWRKTTGEALISVEKEYYQWGQEGF